MDEQTEITKNKNHALQTVSDNKFDAVFLTRLIYSKTNLVTRDLTFSVGVISVNFSSASECKESKCPR